MKKEKLDGRFWETIHRMGSIYSMYCMIRDLWGILSNYQDLIHTILNLFG